MSTPTFDNCDGVYWRVVKKESEVEMQSALYKFEDKNVQPDDLGFKFSVISFKADDADSIEVMSAYIGDVGHFVTNYSRAGYSGLMVKCKVMPKKKIKEMFSKALKYLNFPEKKINSAIKKL